jgi:hypothetical protein
MHVMAVAIAVATTLLASPSAWAQSCNASLNVDTAKLVVLDASDNSGDSVALSCGEAETLRGQIFRQHLAFLSVSQTATAAKVNAEISTSIAHLSSVRQQLAAVTTANETQGLVTLVQSMRWVAAKTKLLLCGGAAAMAGGGLALVACARPFIQFLNQSKTTFAAFATVAEAQQRAKDLQVVIAGLQTDLKKLQLNLIDGSATAQQYAAVFQSMCDQIRKQCLKP